jgi:transposase
MQVVYGRCAGLDVHKKTVVACVLVTGEAGRVQEQVRTFGTMTSALSALSRWLQEQQVEQGARASTGV